MKWYWNAVVGDEQEMAERLLKGQIDGVGSGGMACERFMPSMKVLRLPGLFQSQEESAFVLHKLQHQMTAEATRAGLVFAGSYPLGTEMMWSRQPVRSFAELKLVRAWRWRPDVVATTLDQDMGLRVVLADLHEAAGLFDQRRIDAFWAIPSAALVFQWTIKAPYLLDLNHDALSGCVLFTSRAFAGLSPEDQRVVTAATARVEESFTELTRRTDGALLHGGFQHQGVTVIEPTETFRAEFFAAAQMARKRAGASVVPQQLLDQVLELLSDYRAEHSGEGKP
jgi:TRAP-type C4-dicarboxylate transport system substrate-binding protein